MHRRESLYGPDAEEFRPERWETGELDNIGFGYLQFHGGQEKQEVTIVVSSAEGCKVLLG